MDLQSIISDCGKNIYAARFHSRNCFIRKITVLRIALLTFLAGSAAETDHLIISELTAVHGPRCSLNTLCRDLHGQVCSAFLSSGYSQSASLRSSTPNNCSAVYQEELALFLIQASPHPLLIAFRNPAGDLLDLVKRAKYFSMFISYIVSYQIDISLYHKKRQSRLLNFKSRSVLFLCLCAPPVSVFSEIINTHKNTHNLTCCNGHPYSIHAKDPRQNQYRHE